jgi:hypothetical protein
MNRFLLAVSVVLVFTACSRTANPGSTPPPFPGDPKNPTEPSRRYPAPAPVPAPIPGDNTPYPQDYPREGQRDGVVTIIKTGGDANYENLPPGQAKKKYGGKSAKVYAPGQRKKNGNVTNGTATVISVPEQYASRSTSGQLYYVYRGNTYWKQNDGYYYLANSENGTYQSQEKGKSNGKGKGQGKSKHKDRDDDEDDD